MTLKIERDKRYRTRGGDIVRVLSVDAPGAWPVIGVYEVGHQIERYGADGRVRSLICESSGDIIAEVRTPREWTLLLNEIGHIFGWRDGSGDTIDGRMLGERFPVRVREVLDE